MPKTYKATKETTVVDIHKKNGIRPEFDVYIGRRVQYHKEFTTDSKWGNKFYTRLDLYEQYIRETLWSDLDELVGKRLGCWCVTTDQIIPIQCHGQVLMKLIREKLKDYTLWSLMYWLFAITEGFPYTLRLWRVK